jgi:hypothetical protein
MDWGFHDGMGGFVLKKSGGFMMARGAALWRRGSSMLKEIGGFMVVQKKIKLFHFGPGRAHPGALFDEHGRASRPRPSGAFRLSLPC